MNEKHEVARGRIPLWFSRHIALGLLVCVFLLGGCRTESPEQRLRAQLREMQTAIEKRHPADFMNGVTEDFIGNSGMNRAGLQQLVRMQLLANTSVGVTLGPAEVQLHDDTRATVRFTVLLTGGNSGLLPERAQSYALTSGWRIEGGQWKEIGRAHV